jgi:acyl carrier protein
MDNIHKYLHVLSRVNSSINVDTLNKPVQETGVDSIDLLVIRVELEKYFNVKISDDKWYSIKTLSDALNYFQENRAETHTIPPVEKEINVVRKYKINMPQMSNNALSENWILKEYGDIHWELISKGIGLSSSKLFDDKGEKLYATFIRIRYQISPLSSFSENDEISINSHISRYGDNTYLTTHNLHESNLQMLATTMTSFSIREDDDNTRISKSIPQGTRNYIKDSNRIPEFLNDYRLVRKQLTDEHILCNCNFSISDDPKILPLNIDDYYVDSLGFLISKSTKDKLPKYLIYNINPYYDINGVGLLYYASYPTISDFCESTIMNSDKKCSSNDTWHVRTTTIARDVFYYANCNSCDRIVYTINNFIQVSEHTIGIKSSLFRISDSKKMADIFTIKTDTV